MKIIKVQITKSKLAQMATNQQLHLQKKRNQK